MIVLLLDAALSYYDAMRRPRHPITTPPSYAACSCVSSASPSAIATPSVQCGGDAFFYHHTDDDPLPPPPPTCPSFLVHVISFFSRPATLVTETFSSSSSSSSSSSWPCDRYAACSFPNSSNRTTVTANQPHILWVPVPTRIPRVFRGRSAGIPRVPWHIPWVCRGTHGICGWLVNVCPTLPHSC